MLFHELRHIESHQRLLRTKQKFRQAPRYFGLAYARRPEEEETTHRTQRRLQPRSAAANRPRQRRDGLVLADHPLVQLRLDAQQLLLLVFLNGSDAHARPARNHFFDILARHDARGRVIQLVTLAQPAQVFFFLAFFFRVETRLFKFVIGDRRFHPVRDEFHALLHFPDFFRNGGLPQLHARSGLVN